MGKRIIRPEFVFPHNTRDVNTNNSRNEGLNKESLSMEIFVEMRISKILKFEMI